ncbi:uncharacterized protein CBL_14324 [Carabus blaptoides fortunei]
MSFLHRSLMKQRDSRLPNRAPVKSYTPLAWDSYLGEAQDVTIESNTFRVYLTGTEGPVLALLHGGGYSALTWALFTQEITSRIKCRILALDIRGHGETHTTDDENLSLEFIVDDVIAVVNKLYSGNDPIVFIGHSMGGAIAVHCAHKIPNCVGLCVIDVVEGTAMESLASMQTLLRNRPSNFTSIEQAIQWCYRSGQTQNLESARVSMPGQIKNSASGKLAASEVKDLLENNISDDVVANIPVCPMKHTVMGIPTISEETVVPDPTEMNTVPTSMEPPSSYIWRINLSKTEVHWRGWFQGLSEQFLNTSVPKLLLLANIHGLDTALTVGQMQGKFQMQVLPRCGHAIHEDLPHKVADLIATFLIRHRLTTAVGEYTPIFPAC